MLSRRAISSIGITIFGVFVFVWAATAPSATLKQVSVSGWFHVIWGDRAPGINFNPPPVYVLIDDQGQWTELVLDEGLTKPLGGTVNLNRKRIKVLGEKLTGPRNTVRIYSLQVEKTPNGIAPVPEETSEATVFGTASVNGSKLWANVLCRFADSTGVTPHDRSWFDTLMGSAYPGMDHYWRELSYEKINLLGSRAFGWYNLPQPRSYYIYDKDSDGIVDLDWQRAVEDCTAIADTDVYFPDFYGINLIFNESLDCCAWGGGSTLARDGQTKSYAVTWMPPWGYNNHGVLGHEMGHGFGLPHSSGPYQNTYDSKWDVMSNAYGMCSPSDPVYGCVGVHTISFHKDLLGWIPAVRKYVPAPGSITTITIENLAQPGSSGNYHMAQIPILGSSTHFYTVEARRLVGYDAQIPAEAIIIHRVSTNLGDRLAQVVDVDGNGDPNDAEATWISGETFVDNENGIIISVNSANGTGSQVTISYHPPILYNYLHAPEAFGWRMITGNTLNLSDESSAEITPPFPILFGGGNFTNIYVSSNGNLNFTGPYTRLDNQPIPSSETPTLVAPFWDDLYPIPGTNQNVFWEVLGTAPNRELVIEWREMKHYICRSEVSATIRFQVVFFEGRSDILFNYADTTFGGGCSFLDGGGSSTVGIQVAPDRGTQYSYETTSLNDNTAVLWTLVQLFNFTIGKAGNGSGTVTSNPPGINCGTDSAEPYASGTVVTLTAIPDVNSTFVGWSGDPDCSDGIVTMNTDKICTATFKLASPQADLSITMIDMPDPITTGNNLTYTVAVTNNGPDGATNVMLTDTLPSGVIFVSASSSQGICSQSAGTVTCGLGSLANGTVATVTIVVTPTVPGTINNTANVSASESDPTLSNSAAVQSTTVNSTAVSKLINISTRAKVLRHPDLMHAGFVIQGTGTKQVLIHARGPSLTGFGVPGALANPKIEVYSGQTIIAQNDNWQDTVNCAAVYQCSAPPDPCSKPGFTNCTLEAAVLITLPPGPYTAIVSGVGNTEGVTLVEVFDMDQS